MKGQIVVRRVRFAGAQDCDQSAGEDAHEMTQSHFMGFASGDRAMRAVESAGGTVVSHGEFCPREPYLFCRDPNGYEIKIWYELPTPVDPK